MKECSKSIPRRLRDPNFATRYFRGRGVDIGGAPDPLSLYAELFPLVEGVRIWDREDGDAQYMAGVADDTFDFVHSSHCLEHIVDPVEGLKNWLRVVKPGGHLVIIVPDEDLYEQGVFPSSFNRDHKWTFSIFKPRSWSEKSINLVELVQSLGAGAEVLKIELLNSTHRYSLPRFDQTLTPVGECGIEFVIRKRLPAEVEAGGRLPGGVQPAPELRVHYNQYRDDQQRMKAGNAGAPPFTNDKPL
ncbi:MAG TPA: class I SAM-dependent methyltransferase [Azospirillaceae bacterium]|nr:class I SAM-dependent methyltransferase [Azospirillaceae bacterium]